MSFFTAILVAMLVFNALWWWQADRLVRRAGRNLSTMGPMMTGAVAGSVVNHRETRRLGEEVRADLRR